MTGLARPRHRLVLPGLVSTCQDMANQGRNGAAGFRESSRKPAALPLYLGFAVRLRSARP